MEPPETHELRLWYDTVLVGTIADAFCSDRTWFGAFHMVMHPMQNALTARLHSFLAFRREWHRRLDEDKVHPPDAKEFDQFSDLLSSGLWFVETHGKRRRISEAPVFSTETDISWRVD